MRTQSLYRGDAVFDIADRVVEIAEKYDKRPAQIALAWLLSKPGITSPVVGVSKIEQLDQLVAATEIDARAGRRRLSRGAVPSGRQPAVVWARPSAVVSRVRATPRARRTR